MTKTLTAKQTAFINAYLISWNATKAALEAGYSEKTARFIGAENLTKPNISQEIEKRIKAAVMSADEALARLSDQATANVTEFLGLGIKELKAHPKAHLLKKVKHTVRTVKDGETYETIEFEVYDTQSALVHIMKEQHLKSGEATERIEQNVNLSDTERLAKITAIFDAARARRDGRPADDGEYVQ